MVSASQIRAELVELLSKQIDLDSFEDWIVQNTWNIRKSNDAEAIWLTFEIEAQLAEHSSERISFKELLKELHKMSVPTVVYAQSVLYAPMPAVRNVELIFDNRPAMSVTQLAQARIR